MQQTGSADLVVTPATVTIHRSTATEAYLAHLTISAGSSLFTEWLVITPRQAIHPDYQLHHWLADPIGGAQGARGAFRGVISCPIHTDQLDPMRRHRALVFVVLRLRADAVVTQRIPVVVTEAHAPTLPPPAPAPVFGAMPTASSAPNHPAPPRPAPAMPASPPGWMTQSTAPTRERFCGKCGRLFTATERFCPKDGRPRREQVR